MQRFLTLSLAVVMVGLAAGASMAATGTCVPSCDIQSHLLGYAPPVALVASGSVVTWHTLDTIHTATDGVNYCFHVPYAVNAPGDGFFLVTDGALYAAGEGKPLKRCDAALELPDGSFLLEYVCLYHPNMRANLIVK